MNKLEKILSVIIIFLLICILGGTIFFFLNKKSNTENQKELIAQGKAVSLMAPKNNDKISYFDLGFIRILTKSEKETLNQDIQDEENLGTVLLIRPWITYPANDTVFFEEISRKKTIICGIFLNYFSQFSKNELLSQTETLIEENLKKEINSHFSLGKTEGIYFTDYIFLE